jgi:hypothetical protein
VRAPLSRSSLPSVFGLSERRRAKGTATRRHSVSVRTDANHHSVPSSAEAGFASRTCTQTRYGRSPRIENTSPCIPLRSRGSRLTSAHQT